MTDSARDHAPSTSAATEKEPLPPGAEFAALWEGFLCAKEQFESDLFDAMGDFERTGHDPYDNSIEVYGVPPDTRLSEAAQRVIWAGGFRKAYVNHEDGWETHYSWGAYAEPFAVKRGWRRKPKPDGKGFFVSFWPAGWKHTDWLKTGYVVIEPDPLDAAVAPVEASPRQVTGASSRDEPCQEAERAGGWRPIESAPRDGTRVIMWGAGWDGPQTHQWATPERAAEELRHWTSPPTVWQSLPTPPNSGEGEQGSSVAESGGKAQAPKSESQRDLGSEARTCRCSYSGRTADDRCDHCGLPISGKLLRAERKRARRAAARPVIPAKAEERCARCGQRHVEHDSRDGGFMCADGAGFFQGARDE